MLIFFRSPPTSDAVGVTDAGAFSPMSTTGSSSWTWNATPIASWGEFGAWVTKIAFQSPATGNSVLATYSPREPSIAQTKVAGTAVPGSLDPGGMKATCAVRSGLPTGRLVSGSRNEKTKRYGPFSCWPMITGMTDGLDVPDAAGPEAAAPGAAEAGAVDQPGCAFAPPPQAVATTAASASSATRAGAAGRGDGRRMSGA